MKIIGITGGVGAGKSHILDYIVKNYKARIIKTDEAVELLRTPGHVCYEKIVELLGSDILREDKTIDKNKMAQIIFADKEKLTQINQMIHPEVNRYVAEQIEIITGIQKIFINTDNVKNQKADFRYANNITVFNLMIRFCIRVKDIFVKVVIAMVQESYYKMDNLL